MARKCLKEREKKRVKLVAKYAKKREELKAEGNYLALSKLPRDSSRVRRTNRCVLTGRSRAYIRKFGLCRNKFRQLALEGELPGVTKSSW
ncbi:MAG: small subunit ribosomal protein S14 [Myxococcota bacterium]|jgi:small subunit ribosomal protein S14